MGLVAKIKRDVGRVFDRSLGDIPQTLTYQSSDVADGAFETYDPATGAGGPTTADDYTAKTIKAVQGKIDASFFDKGLAQASDMKWIVKGQGLDFTPKVGDMLTLNSKNLPVYRVQQIPTEAIWIIYVRGGTLDA